MSNPLITSNKLKKMFDFKTSIKEGALVYDEQDVWKLKSKTNPIMSSQVYKVGSYLRKRVDIIFYNSGFIYVYFLDNEEEYVYNPESESNITECSYMSNNLEDLYTQILFFFEDIHRISNFIYKV